MFVRQADILFGHCLQKLPADNIKIKCLFTGGTMEDWTGRQQNIVFWTSRRVAATSSGRVRVNQDHLCFPTWEGLGSTILSNTLFPALNLSPPVTIFVGWRPVILFGHFTPLYGSHSQSKNGLYFPNFMHFSTYFPNCYDIFSPNVTEKVAFHNPQ